MGNKTNFSKNGIFNDKYFGKSSNDIENLWIIIYEDHLIPKTITNNIILVLPKKIISVFCVLKKYFINI